MKYCMLYRLFAATTRIEFSCVSTDTDTVFGSRSQYSATVKGRNGSRCYLCESIFQDQREQ
jgi:hypothetical protein